MYICERSRFSAWVKAKEGREGVREREEDEETDEMEEHLKHTPPLPPTPKGGRRRERKGEPPRREMEGRKDRLQWVSRSP